MALPAELFTMKYMDMRSGETGGEPDDKGKMKNPGLDFSDSIDDHFEVIIRSSAFQYDYDTNTISVKANSLTEETDVIIYWKGGNLAFSSLPIEQKIHITYVAPPNYRYISFDSNGGSYVQPIATPAGQPITWPDDPTRTGYVFAGWYYGDGTPYNGSTTVMPTPTSGNGIDLVAHWDPRTDTKYKVEHYQQSLSGTFELVETDTTHTGTTAHEFTTAELEELANTYDHFAFAPSLTPRTTIFPSGNTVVRLYYTRDVYRITFNYGICAELDPKYTEIVYNLKYGETVYAPRLAVNGYIFDGFQDAGGNAFAMNEETGGHMAAANEAYTAQWTARNDISYQTRHYWQTVDGLGYALEEVVYGQGTAGTDVTATAKTYGHFTYDDTASEEVASGKIARDGSLVLKLYYNRKQYTVTLNPNGGTWPDGTTGNRELTLYYGAPIPEGNEPMKDGEAFGGWYTADGKPFGGVSGDVTLNAKWGEGVNFNINYHLMDVTGNYPSESTHAIGIGTPGDRITLSDLMGVNFEINAKEFTYDYAEMNGQRVTEATVEAGMTVDLYYSRNQYRVTWHLNSDSEDDVVQTLYYGAVLTPPTDEPAWCTDEDCTQPWIGEGTVDGDMDFYAKWPTPGIGRIRYFAYDKTELTGDNCETYISNYNDLPFTYDPATSESDKPVDALLTDSNYLFIGWCTDLSDPSGTMVTSFEGYAVEGLDLYMVCLDLQSDDYFYIRAQWEMEALSRLSSPLTGNIMLATDFTLENWSGIGEFKGSVFDGGGHTVTLTGHASPLINQLTQNFMQVKNLTVHLDDVTAVPYQDGTTVYWGAVAGKAHNTGLFTDCHVTGSVTMGDASVRSRYFGGMVGYLMPRKGGLLNCTAGEENKPLEMIGFNGTVGGLVGYMYSIYYSDDSNITYTGSTYYNNVAVTSGPAISSDAEIFGGLVGTWRGRGMDGSERDSRKVSASDGCVVNTTFNIADESTLIDFSFGGVIGEVSSCDMTFEGLTVTCGMEILMSTYPPANIKRTKQVGALFGSINTTLGFIWTANNIAIKDCRIDITGNMDLSTNAEDKDREISSILASCGVEPTSLGTVTYSGDNWLIYGPSGQRKKGTVNNSNGSITYTDVSE